MTSLFKITALYQGPAGLPGTNTFYGSEGDVAVADMRTELDEFYSFYASHAMHASITVTIPSSGDIIDSTDGALLGVWTDGTPEIITGGISGDVLPPATQLLVQFNTGDVVAGRRLHGRVFLPGCTETLSVGGAPDPDLVTEMAAQANTDFNGDFAVYSPTHHEWATISSCGVWNEWAVLRSRRP